MTGQLFPSHPIELNEPAVPLTPVSEMLKLFTRAVRAHQLYLPNNPMHARALYAVRASYKAVWEHTDLLTLTVTETQFQLDGHVVLEEGGRGSDSLPWLFYKDGIRSLELRPGFEEADLRRLLDAVQQARTSMAEDDDLLTLLWECEFTHFQYHYADLVTDGVPPHDAELLRGGAPSGTIPAPAEVEQGAAEPGDGSAGIASPFARIEDYDSTLYFLDGEEITYLQNAIRDEFSADLRPSVVAALLDTFEQEETPEVREEICSILDTFLLVLLSNSQFRAAAYLLHETKAAVERSVSLLPSHQQRLLELANRMSEPEVLTQVLHALEEVDCTVFRDDLDALFAQFRSIALAPLLMQLARTHNAQLRPLLEQAAARLAMSHTSDLIALIGGDDEAVALEAVRRAGALRSPAAVTPLARLLSEASPELRKAAVLALVDIGSAGAMHALELAVEDDDREIRMAAVRAIADRQHRAAMARVERVLKERIMHESHNMVEKATFFDAYAALAGDGAVAFLDSILTPKGLLARKEDVQTRACVAATLGKMGTTRAGEALRRASTDKDVVIRAAVSRSLRGLGRTT